MDQEHVKLAIQLVKLASQLYDWTKSIAGLGKAVPESFNEHAQNARDYSLRLRDEIADGRWPADFSGLQAQALINGLSINAMNMARRAIKDRLPRGVRGQLMVFSARTESLVMWMSSGRQSYDSIRQPWSFRGMAPHRCIEHDGICVRAFCTGGQQLKTTMQEEKLNRGESIACMLAQPVVIRPEAKDGDIAVVNVVSFTPGFVPKELTPEQQVRLEAVRDLCRNINTFRHLAGQAERQAGH